MTQSEPERAQARSEHPAHWSEDALPEGIGAAPAGGGAAPARQAEVPDTPPARGTLFPLALVIALAAMAVPTLWAAGYWLSGAPGSGSVWPLAIVALGVAGAVLGYWLARRSSGGEDQ